VDSAIGARLARFRANSCVETGSVFAQWDRGGAKWSRPEGNVMKSRTRISVGDVIAFVVSLVAAMHLVGLTLAWWGSSPFHF